MYTAGQYLFERLPDRVVGVECDRELYVQGLYGFDDVVGVRLERELRRVDTYDDQSMVLVLLGPRTYVAERPQPVDARVRAEVGEDDPPVQIVRGERLRVEPAGRPIEAG
jgi:hypothetical protein